MSNDLALRQHLVALTPAELPGTQAALGDWCLQKMRSLGQEYRELSENLAIAKKNRWSRGGLITAVRRVKGRIQYYRKIRVAVQAGYLIVPNFPIEVIAVRVSRNAPARKEGRWDSDVNTAQPELLPPGAGRYVDGVTFTQDASYNRTDPQTNKSELVRRRASAEFDPDIDFPVIGVKPIIMEATARAMALKVFDRIGVANHSGQTRSSRQRKADPIIIGQLIDPKYKGRWNEKVVSFFVAWWLDTDVL